MGIIDRRNPLAKIPACWPPSAVPKIERPDEEQTETRPPPATWPNVIDVSDEENGVGVTPPGLPLPNPRVTPAFTEMWKQLTLAMRRAICLVLDVDGWDPCAHWMNLVDFWQRFPLEGKKHFLSQQYSERITQVYGKLKRYGHPSQKARQWYMDTWYNACKREWATSFPSS